MFESATSVEDNFRLVNAWTRKMSMFLKLSLYFVVRLFVSIHTSRLVLKIFNLFLGDLIG